MKPYFLCYFLKSEVSFEQKCAEEVIFRRSFIHNLQKLWIKYFGWGKFPKKKKNLTNSKLN